MNTPNLCPGKREWNDHRDVGKQSYENNRDGMACTEVSIRLCIDERSLRKNTLGGGGWASIHVETEHACFPSHKWIDLAGAFLCEWLKALVRLYLGSEKAFTVSFLDGPYTIALSSVGEEVEIRCYRDYYGNRTLVQSSTEDIRILIEDGLKCGTLLEMSYTAAE